jgi:hypothetical protein
MQQRYRLGRPVEIRSVGKQVELYKIGQLSHLTWRWRASTRRHAMNHDSTKATGLGVEGPGIDSAIVVMPTISRFLARRDQAVTAPECVAVAPSSDRMLNVR